MCSKSSTTRSRESSGQQSLESTLASFQGFVAVNISIWKQSEQSHSFSSSINSDQNIIKTWDYLKQTINRINKTCKKISIILNLVKNETATSLFNVVIIVLLHRFYFLSAIQCLTTRGCSTCVSVQVAGYHPSVPSKKANFFRLMHTLTQLIKQLRKQIGIWHIDQLQLPLTARLPDRTRNNRITATWASAH